jgi:hypothetical protein
MLLIIGCTHTLFAKKLTSGAKKEGTTAKNWPEGVCVILVDNAPIK